MFLQIRKKQIEDKDGKKIERPPSPPPGLEVSVQDPSFVDVAYCRGELDEPVQDQRLLKRPPRPSPLSYLHVQVPALCKAWGVTLRI